MVHLRFLRPMATFSRRYAPGDVVTVSEPVPAWAVDWLRTKAVEVIRETDGLERAVTVAGGGSAPRAKKSRRRRRAAPVAG